MARRWTTVEEKIKRKELVQLYVRENKTLGEVAKTLNLAEASVYDRLIRLNIPSLRHKKPGYNNVRRDIFIPNKSEDLAEFVGILLGDGSLTPTQVTVTLGTKEEEYVEYVRALMRKLFAVTPKKLLSKDEYYSVYIGSTVLVRWFLEMGLKYNKVRDQVDVPRWIFSRKAFMKKTLCGLFDTDGSVYKLKFGVQISFCNRSNPLIESTRLMLSRLGYHPSRVSCYNLYLTRQEDLYKFFREIGFNNPKHKRRFIEFMKR